MVCHCGKPSVWDEMCPECLDERDGIVPIVAVIYLILVKYPNMRDLGVEGRFVACYDNEDDAVARCTWLNSNCTDPGDHIKYYVLEEEVG